MPSLLDVIKQNSATMATDKQGLTDQTQNVASIMRAKSGKATTGGDTGMSNLGEQAAVASTNQQLGQAAGQQQVQAAGQTAQAVGQQQDSQNQLADVAQGRKFNALQNKMQTTALLNQFQQDQGKLDLQRNGAQVDQFVQGLRLQNQQYTDNLQREGEKMRLDQANQFKEEFAKATFGDNIDFLNTQLGDKSVLDANDRDYSSALAKMGLDSAWTVFNRDAAATNQQGMYKGVDDSINSGLAAVGKYQEKHSATPAASAAAPALPPAPADNADASDFSNYG